MYQHEWISKKDAEWKKSNTKEYILVTLKVQEYMKLIYSDGNQKSIISKGGTGWEVHETIFSFWMDVTLPILN